MYANTYVGIWGDVACHYWEIVGNTVTDNVRYGILYEVSDYAIIESNIVTNNSHEYSGLPGDWCRGGITVGESAFVEVFNNTVTNSKGGIVVQQTFRPFGTCTPGQFCEADFFAQFDDITLVCSDILIRDNTIIGAAETGVGNAESGFGQLSASSNIQYVCNDYQNPENMDFYWFDGLKQNYSQWQAAGRDVCSSDPGGDDNGNGNSDSNCNLITNSEFETNLDGWIRWSCNTNWDNGKCMVSNIQDVANPWHAAVSFPDIVLETNTEYTLNFDAVSIGSPRALSIKVGKATAPYTSVELSLIHI